MIYLGEYDTPDSRKKWSEIVSDWSAGNLDKYGSAVSIARLSVAYTKFARKYYVKDGKQTSEAIRVGSALRFLVAECKDLQTDKFTPKHLERVRNRMIRKKLSRGVINTYVSIITRAFKFGVVEGCVPANVWQALKALPGLRRGRTQATESKPVEPVSPLVVIKTLRQLGPVVAAMVRLQYVTGMRPGEVCMMRVCNLDRTGDVWRYAPEGHKTVHHGKKRIIQLGRKAQRILQPFLNRTEDSYVFSPSHTHDLRHEKPFLRTTYPDGYDRTSYRRAINRACSQGKIPDWTPNQLRHTFATIIRKRFGLEAAQILLGHSKADVTQVYAERDATLAEKVAREVG